VRLLIALILPLMLSGCMTVYAGSAWPCSRIDEIQGLSEELLAMKGKGEYPKTRTYIVESDAKCAADRVR